MTGHALAGALKGAFALPHTIHNWYQEKTFWLYYYSLSYDPEALLNTLPVSPAIADRLSTGIDGARNSFISSTATRIAAGDEAKPTFGNVWTGFMAHMQNGLRPMLETALRTNLSGPLRFALLAMTAVLLVDAFYGGPITQAVATFNSESGRTAEVKHAIAPKKPRKTKTPKPDFRPDAFKLYGQPSFS